MNKGLLLSLLFLLFTQTLFFINAKPSINKKDFKEIKWENLLPEGMSTDSLMKKYQKQIYNLADADPNAATLFDRIQKELDNLPPNKKMDGEKIKIPGFIAPLETVNGQISELLLVPYFGQCIHSPPPPVNQTIFIKFKKSQGVPDEKAYMPIWVYGTIKIKKQTTELTEAGYEIANATFEFYEDI